MEPTNTSLNTMPPERPRVRGEAVRDSAPEAHTEPRPLAAILEDLAKPIPKRMLATKALKGNKITFCPWHRVVKILDHYTAGRWAYEVVDKTITATHFLITVRLTITAADGTVYREGTGIEALDVKGYGDFQSNSESMALRRAAAKFGLGLHLYEKED